MGVEARGASTVNLNIFRAPFTIENFTFGIQARDNSTITVNSDTGTSDAIVLKNNATGAVARPIFHS